MTQLSFATLDHQNKKKRTKREAFLAEMDEVVPWTKLLGLIEPFYPKIGNGRRPYDLSLMLRIYFLQQWSSCPIQAPKMRSMISSRCVPSPVLNLATMRYLTRRRSSTFGICLNAMT